MSLQERKLPNGWGIISHSEPNNSTILEGTVRLLSAIHPSLTHRFLHATKQDISIGESTHPIEALANWLMHDSKSEGELEKFHVRDTACVTQRRHLILSTSLKSPFIAYVAQYVTWEGHNGYAVALHEVDTSGEEPRVGKSILKTRIEQNQQKDWETQEVMQALQQMQLLDVSSAIDEYYVMIEPVSSFSPSGQPLELLQAA